VQFIAASVKRPSDRSRIRDAGCPGVSGERERLDDRLMTKRAIQSG
jgi:hypothetical protein